MFGIGGSVRIYYCPTPINLRKSFDGLAGAVEEYIKQDPESGHVFAFFSRNKKLVKLLQWEDGGFVIWMKRLEQGGFHILGVLAVVRKPSLPSKKLVTTLSDSNLDGAGWALTLPWRNS